MALLIKNMKMPKNCKECTKMGISHCPMEEEPVIVEGNDKPINCPIVGEIPDNHGRIIDEKWVELYILKYFSIEFPNEMEKVYKLLKFALEDVPTILEASK